jgi:hypothetical protein
MADLTNTTLAADVGANDTVLKLTSTTGYPAVGTISNGNQVRMQINGEFMYHVETIASGTVRVRSRGADGTLAVAHDLLSNVSMGAPGDFPAYPVGAEAPRPAFDDDIVSVGENGVIAVPTKNTTIYLTKATALTTTTLGAPTQAQNGLRLTITSQTAAAHVITATALLGDAASGSPEDTATFDAFIGASMTLVASDGIWNIVAVVGVVIT